MEKLGSPLMLSQAGGQRDKNSRILLSPNGHPHAGNEPELSWCLPLSLGLQAMISLISPNVIGTLEGSWSR